MAGKVVNNVDDNEYFCSYDEVAVHELMLKDSARLSAYRSFIESNPDQFVDKIVIDVGSGTGILALLAARAGAKHVYAIEAATGIASLSEEIIKRNNYGHKVTVIKGVVEDVELPNGELADVLISEWMGFYLLHESMLDAVIVARDRLLKSGGSVFPSSATLYACPVALKQYCQERFQFWHSVCGFDFSPVAALNRSASLSCPEVTTLSEQMLLSQPQEVINIDLQFVDICDVSNIVASLNYTIERNDVMHGFALWFKVNFNGGNPVEFSTSPSAVPTHWKQTVALLPDSMLVNKTAALSCRIHLERSNTHRRRYNINIDLIDDDSDGEDDDCENIDDPIENNTADELRDIISHRMNPAS